MRTIRNVIAVIGALGPVLYCGSLVMHFFDVGGSVEGVKEIGLGPTVIGLSVVGMLFCIPLAFKIMRLMNDPRGSGPGRGPRGPEPDDSNGFDADAAIARYMAEKSAQPPAPPVRPATYTAAPAKPAGFGRRTR